MDLLSTVLHEMGSLLGIPEDAGLDVMTKTLAAGERALPVFAGALGSASGLPVIDWSVNNAAVATFMEPGNAAETWVDGFLNNLGRTDGRTDGRTGKASPNHTIRIKLPGG
jgi:hypothetical protein